MDKGSRGYNEIIEFLRNFDLSYVFKRKRLRYMKTAAVNSEIRYMKDNFFNLWRKDGKQYKLDMISISEKGQEILRGVLGNSSEAEAFLDLNKTMVSIDSGLFEDFLGKCIASKKAAKNLYTILFGEGSDSIVHLIKEQIPYIEKYLPTVRKFDKEKPDDIILKKADLDTILHFLERYDMIVENFTHDIQLYKRFIRDFKRLYRENAVPDIIGYGEISTVMRLSHPRMIDAENEESSSGEYRWIWKKMPPFPTKEEVRRFEELYEKYRDILVNSIGLAVPEQMMRYFRHENYYIVYACQERMDSRFICHSLIKKLDPVNARKLFKKILEKLKDIYQFNKRGTGINIGFDAQLSNWVLVSQQCSPDIVHDEDGLVYIDTSSPMIRINGQEQLNTEIFIKSAASFLRPIIRKFFLQEVLDRYYDMRSVTVDIIANLHKEKRTDLIDGFIEIAGDFFINNGMTDEGFTRKEIDKYYSGDAFIWRFYQASRKIDRFITEKILRGKYIFKIPGKVER